MKALVILLFSLVVFGKLFLAHAASAKPTDDEGNELMAIFQIINHQTLPYKAEVMQRMLIEANYFADRLNLPTSHPMQMTGVEYSLVGDPWYSIIKETNYPYFPETVFGHGICNTNIPREERINALKIGVSGTFETTNFCFRFNQGKLCDVERLSKHEVERYADNLEALVGQPSLIDTNGAYQLATQWLAAVDVDMPALNKLKWTVNQLHYKTRGATNYVTLPIYYVDFGNKHTPAQNNLKASDEPLVSVEILGTTKELQNLDLVNDLSLSRRPAMLITNILELVRTPDPAVKLGFKLPVRQTWWVKYHQLSTEERYEIAAMRRQGLRMVAMAKHLGRHRSPLYREVKRNQSVHDGRYRASHSVEKASGRKRRARRNFQYGPTEFASIEPLIRKGFSPEQIVGRRNLEGQPVMSHETIYRWIWRDKRCGGTLWRHLRGARKQRRKRYGRYDSRGRLAGKKSIEQRPTVVANRGRIGDWEIDTVHGRGKACVVTVVERKTGLVRIGPIQRATKQLTLARTVKLLWAERQRVKTITADNGTEFHNYRELESILDTEVYFATPHHAWERGTNENTNGLIRQYLPKGTNLSRLTQAQCDRIAEQLNNRPRLRLGFRTPNEAYY